MVIYLPYLFVFLKEIYNYWVNKRPHWYMITDLMIFFPLNQRFFLLWSWWSIFAQSIRLSTCSICLAMGKSLFIRYRFSNALAFFFFFWHKAYIGFFWKISSLTKYVKTKTLAQCVDIFAMFNKEQAKEP